MTVLENFISPATIEERLSGVSIEDLTEDDREALQAFRTAMERRRQGKPDLDDMGHVDNEDD